MTDTIDKKVHTRVTKTTRIDVTLEQKQYEKILRAAVDAPDDATVSIENAYGGDVTISWTVTETEGDD